MILFLRKKSFEKLSGLNIRCEIEEKIKHYNNLMATANPNLIDLYVNLYLRENTQEGVSCEFFIEAIIRLIRRRRAESMIIAFKTRSVWNVWLCEGLFRNIF